MSPVTVNLTLYTRHFIHHCGDNAACERFFGQLKRERVAHQRYRTLDEARGDPFLLTPRFMGEEEKVRLSWRQKATDYPMQPYHLSDGSLRFICLVTALLQPTTMLPSTILIDEPELGLHPYAIEVLADILQEVSEKTQLIISTQSPALVDNFEPENVVVVGRKNNNSTFKRLNKEYLASWLEDYSLGELWQKNVIAGAPSYDF